MIRLVSRHRSKLRDADPEAGFTLVEVLISLFLFGILTTVLFAVVRNSSNTLATVRQNTDLNEEARAVMNRITRELREASVIYPVVVGAPLGGTINPAGSTYNSATDTAIDFGVDFDGNLIINAYASDPERLRYHFDYPNRRLLIETTSGQFPILADNVEAFKISYFSQTFSCDIDKDGSITWEEVESAPPDCPVDVGDSDSPPNLDIELGSINRVVIDLTVLKGIRRQDYRTQIDMRNRPL